MIMSNFKLKAKNPNNLSSNNCKTLKLKMTSTRSSNRSSKSQMRNKKCSFCTNIYKNCPSSKEKTFIIKQFLQNTSHMAILKGSQVDFQIFTSSADKITARCFSVKIKEVVLELTITSP